MKLSPVKKPLTFGEFIEGSYRAWGKRKAKGMIQLIVKAHYVEFRGPDRFIIS